MSNPRGVEVVCEIVQVKSMVDRSTNVTINIPEYCQEQALEIMRHVKEQAKAVIEFEEV